MVIAVGGEADIQQYPKIVKHAGTRNQTFNHILTQQILSTNLRWSVLSLQHEYGIFGGPDGEYVLNFLERLQVPIITTLAYRIVLHPVLTQKRIVQRIAELSDAIMVMVKMGKDMLVTNYGVPRRR